MLARYEFYSLTSLNSFVVRWPLVLHTLNKICKHHDKARVKFTRLFCGEMNLYFPTCLLPSFPETQTRLLENGRFFQYILLIFGDCLRKEPRVRCDAENLPRSISSNSSPKKDTSGWERKNQRHQTVPSRIYEEAFQNERDEEGRRSAYARKNGFIPMGFAWGLFPVLWGYIVSLLFEVPFSHYRYQKHATRRKNTIQAFWPGRPLRCLHEKHQKRGGRTKGKRP